VLRDRLLEKSVDRNHGYRVRCAGDEKGYQCHGHGVRQRHGDEGDAHCGEPESSRRANPHLSRQCGHNERSAEKASPDGRLEEAECSDATTDDAHGKQETERRTGAQAGGREQYKYRVYEHRPVAANKGDALANLASQADCNHARHLFRWRSVAHDEQGRSRRGEGEGVDAERHAGAERVGDKAADSVANDLGKRFRHREERVGTHEQLVRHEIRQHSKFAWLEEHADAGNEKAEPVHEWQRMCGGERHGENQESAGQVGDDHDPALVETIDSYSSDGSEEHVGQRVESQGEASTKC
jgi:hypothetical protein